MRDRIAEELYGHGALQKKRQAFILIGPPASGKSTEARHIIEEHGALEIDSDLAKALIPEYDAGRNAAGVHLESDLIVTKMVLPRAVIARDNIVIAIVGRSVDKLRDMRRLLKRFRYSVHLILVHAEPHEAARRAVRRFETTGRFVDPEYVLEVGDQPTRNYLSLKSVGRWRGRFDSYRAINLEENP